MLTWEETDRLLIDASRVFHFGAVSLSGEPCRTTIRKAVEYAKSKGKIISYDPNYRPFLWKSEAEAKAEMGKFLHKADVLKVSEEEMFFLTGISDPEKGARFFAEKGIAIVLVSLGDKGAFFLCNNGCGYVNAYKADTVDTRGAGDAFLGAVHYGLRGKSLGDLENIPASELKEIVSFACAAGSLTTTKRGGIPALPALAEIEPLCMGNRHS
jgi:fructokinase